MLFSIAVGGHYSNYIQCLIDYWCRNKFAGKLYILTSPKFIEKHFESIKIATNCEDFNVEFVSITESEYSEVLSQKRGLGIALAEWKLLKKYIKKLQVSHCLLMFLDHFQLLLALGFILPCEFSGIYFRPAFHYSNFSSYVFRYDDLLRQWRQRALIFQALKNSRLKFIFCLDPFVLKHFEKSQNKSKTIFLPDPIRKFKSDISQAELFKARLQISETRRIFLLFGQLDERKGIYQLLQAIELLPANLCEKLCLLLVGSMTPQDQQLIEALIQKMSCLLPIQIVVKNEFVSELEMQRYFQISDVVLAPYQRHVGMSGILLLAAAAQKPILSSNYGLMGEIAHQYELGLAVDSASPHSVAQALTRLLTEQPEKFCNPSKMQCLVEQHEADKFAQTIFTHIFDIHSSQT
jgi:glycosyltransferase involved in cell wall biosynthesis